MKSYFTAQIAVALPVEGPFDYFIPAELQSKIKIGHRVCVPFRSDTIVGYVVGLSANSDVPKLKPIQSLLENEPFFDRAFLKLAEEFAHTFACSLGEAIEVMLPKALRSKKKLTWTPPIVQTSAITDASLTLFQGSLAEASPFVVEQIKQTLVKQQSVIVLLPEGRQIQNTKAFLEQQLNTRVAVLDRKLTPAQEFAEWLSFKTGQVQVAVGTRSAVFACAVHLGLMVMIDEDHMAYKQEPSPFYHARDVVLMRYRLEKHHVIFVSHAPSVELWKTIKDQNGNIKEAAAPRLAPLAIIDLTNYKPQSQRLIAFPVQNPIQSTLEQGGKVLLFLNRRGFSLMTRCNQCGFIVRCPRCQVTLSFLYSQKQCVCHRCGHKEDLPKFCPQCRSTYLRSTGAGIEKLESELSRVYPLAQIRTFDRESTTLNLQDNLVLATSAILPLLAKAGFHLIVVLDFDGEVNRVDFRASQRAFSLLIRFRHAAQNKVIVQTANPRHPAVQCAQSLNIKPFYQQELKNRRELAFPPYRHFIAVSVRGLNEEAVFAKIKDLFLKLSEINDPQIEILDPQPDLTPKLRDQYRFTIMLKVKKLKPAIQKIYARIMSFKKERGMILTVDVNP